MLVKKPKQNKCQESLQVKAPLILKCLNGIEFIDFIFHLLKKKLKSIFCLFLLKW